jgi:teichuronic acid biosynthesis glycosyltransferase TuaG
MNYKKNNLNPLVSIVMTCYNSSSTLKDAIASVKNQSYENWELIFIDDGSTDNSLKIIKEILDDRIKVYSLGKNYGRGFSYQKGLDVATGKFIMFLDSDDWWYSNKILKQINYLKKNENVMIVGSGLITTENYNPIGIRCDKKTHNVTNNNDISDPEIGFATICIRNQILSNYSFDKNLKVAQDIDFLRSLCMNEIYSNLNDVLYVYNEYSSLSLSKVRKSFKNTKIGLKKYKKNFFIKYYKNIIKANFKVIFYSLFFFIKLEKLLLKLRVRSPSQKELKIYYEEKDSMLVKRSTLFKN